MAYKFKTRNFQFLISFVYFCAKINEIMIKIPYSGSDFRKIRLENRFYQNRTQFIETLENWTSNYPVFLRPPTFTNGKNGENTEGYTFNF